MTNFILQQQKILQNVYISLTASMLVRGTRISAVMSYQRSSDKRSRPIIDFWKARGHPKQLINL